MAAGGGGGGAAGKLPGRIERGHRITAGGPSARITPAPSRRVPRTLRPAHPQAPVRPALAGPRPATSAPSSCFAHPPTPFSPAPTRPPHSTESLLCRLLPPQHPRVPTLGQTAPMPVRVASMCVRVCRCPCPRARVCSSTRPYTCAFTQCSRTRAWGGGGGPQEGRGGWTPPLPERVSCRPLSPAAYTPTSCRPFSLSLPLSLSHWHDPYSPGPRYTFGLSAAAAAAAPDRHASMVGSGAEFLGPMS